MQFNLDVNKIRETDLSELYEKFNWSDDGKLVNESPGNQHYKLLAYISKEVAPKLVLEIGTRWGVSAAALATNPVVRVVTCDLCDQTKEETLPENVTFILRDGFDVIDEYVHEADLIFMDVDPHDGVQERKMIDKLTQLEYKGVLILDDINLNESMQTLWNSITQDKLDISPVGHYSGTGIVFFGKDHGLTLIQKFKRSS